MATATTCPTCATPLQPQWRLCPTCGLQLQDALGAPLNSPPPASSTHTCPQCGAPISVGQPVCNPCGLHLDPASLAAYYAQRFPQPVNLAPPPPVPVAGPTPYTCRQCRAPIYVGQPACSNCGRLLEWNRVRTSRAPFRTLAVFLILGVCLWWGLTAVTGGSLFGLNSAPPTFVKSVYASAAGADGISAYFTLADAGGAYTTADGTVTVTLESTPYGQAPALLLSRTFPVKKSDFQQAKVGVGAFEHEVILLNLGRISYNSFLIPPPSGGSGKMTIEFKTANGQVLKGSDSAYFGP